jgi:hypothetical protein
MDIQYELAQLLKEIGYTGVVTLVVSAELARRLVASNPWFAGERQEAEALARMPPTIVDGLEGGYALGDVPADWALVRTDDRETTLILPHHMRLTP